MPAEPPRTLRERQDHNVMRGLPADLACLVRVHRPSPDTDYEIHYFASFDSGRIRSAFPYEIDQAAGTVLIVEAAASNYDHLLSHSNAVRDDPIIF